MRHCWCGGEVGWREPSALANPIEVCLESDVHVWDATGRPERIETLYIAGPMTGYPQNNYPAFREAEHRLQDAGYKTVNPADFGAAGGHYVDLIREDLRAMLDCHGVAIIENWWESVGARNEVQVAGILKMPVRTTAEWLSRAALELA